MELVPALLVFLAGIAAGAINAVVGSGTLITFPTLVAFGVPPVTATMSNAVGLVPGNIASSLGYREELAGQRKRLLQLIPASLLGALCGAWLLLHLPERAFIRIVPVMLVVALVLVVVQPALQRWLRSRKKPLGGKDAPPRQEASGEPPRLGPVRAAAVVLLTFLTAIYGGYFAAAQGIILVAVLGMLLPETLQRINGAKNVLVLVVNTVAALCYITVGFDRIDWWAVVLIAVGSLIGGYLGARVGRRFNPIVLRALIVVLGLVALWRILGM